MGAYVIGNIRIKDQQKWQRYRDQVPATLERWGAELVFRGVTNSVFSGDYPQTDVVVISFPDQASAQGWFHSAAYQALIALREEAADVVLVSYDA